MKQIYDFWTMEGSNIPLFHYFEALCWGKLQMDIAQKA